MAKKEKSKRRIRKDMLEYLEDTYDPTQLDFVGRIKPKKELARIYALVAAIIVYAIGFSASYYGWKINNVSYELFVKITWVLMLPASVFGIVVWLLKLNRLENVVRHEFFVLIRQIEADKGMLWRFKPLMSTFDPNNLEAKKVMAQSEAGQSTEIDPEDYTNTVNALFSELKAENGVSIPAETAAEVTENMNSQR